MSEAGLKEGKYYLYKDKYGTFHAVEGQDTAERFGGGRYAEYEGKASGGYPVVGDDYCVKVELAYTDERGFTSPAKIAFWRWDDPRPGGYDLRFAARDFQKKVWALFKATGFADDFVAAFGDRFPA